MRRLKKSLRLKMPFCGAESVTFTGIRKMIAGGADAGSSGSPATLGHALHGGAIMAACGFWSVRRRP